jgi:hypothetical protein
MKALILSFIRLLGRAAFEPILSEILSNQFNHSQEIQTLLMQQYKNMVRNKIRPLPTFDEVGFRCYSQFEEDGILLYIFSLIGSTNKVAVEICAGDGMQCNTTNLIVNHGWQSLLFDGNKQNVERGQRFFSSNKDTFLCPPKFNHAWITVESINSVIKNAGVSGSVDLLSLDLDGMDYWAWKALDCISPRVVVCETLNVIGPDKALTVPYDPGFINEVQDYHGASLAAMSKLAAQKGYRLVGTHRYGFNAFFVRNDVGEDLLPAVLVSDCLQHPYAQHAMKERWPKVKDMKWLEV